MKVGGIYAVLYSILAEAVVIHRQKILWTIGIEGVIFCEWVLKGGEGGCGGRRKQRRMGMGENTFTDLMIGHILQKGV